MLLDEASDIDMQPLMRSTNILRWQLGQNMQCKGVVPVTTTIEGVVVGVGVAVAGLAIALAVPGVHHLMV
jgi:hypothetical protein